MMRVCATGARMVRGQHVQRLAARAVSDHLHFKLTNKPHPLYKSPDPKVRYDEELKSGDHTGRLQNHIWTKAEIEDCMSHLYRHKPATISDQIANKLVRSFSICAVAFSHLCHADVWLVSYV